MTEQKKKYEDLCSSRWYAPDDLRSFGHRSRTLQMGYDPQDWVGKPVIAIINTWSDINPCHSQTPHYASALARSRCAYIEYTTVHTCKLIQEADVVFTRENRGDPLNTQHVQVVGGLCLYS